MDQIDVLIVEDNPKISRTHQAFVEKVEGFTVAGIANSIEEAQLLLTTLEPELILLDIYFSESSGIDFLRTLRTSDNPCDVILITAAREVEMLHKALHGGAFDYMIKPVFFERFRESLTNYRLHRDALRDGRDLSQDDADVIFGRNRETSVASPVDTPKGIDAVTLEKIQSVIDARPDEAYSASYMGQQAGVSRTTARKYLEYLVAAGVLSIDLDYGTKGRPERLYRLSRPLRA